MRIYISPEAIEKQISIELPPDKSRHAVSVMRCKTGDNLTVFDGRGRSYQARISGIQKKGVLLDIIEELAPEAESTLSLVLCQGILKGEKMDLVVQKATELGIDKIVPLISARCQVRETRRTNRWRKIAEEAAEQCGRSVVPEISEPQAFGDFFEKNVTAAESKGIIFWEKGGVAPYEAVDKAGMSSSGPFFLFIGPEGGFEQAEVDTAEALGFVSATLGRRTLRADTASIAAVALIQFLADKNKTTHEV
jgi:16S rRNA (uracil1498-N3)-methyltransferase